MKLIAKTIKGKEFLHSRTECAFVSNSSAEKICKIMNDTKFRLKSENEIWHTYDYDFTQDLYVSHKLTIYKGIVKLKAIE
jgi:hypothetical protein